MRGHVILGRTLISSGRLRSTKPKTMNKIIFTNDRLFMSIVGPSGSGKSRLIFSMLASSTTFEPPADKIYYFYKDHQPLFKEMEEKLNIEFLSCLNIQMIKGLENCMLVFDDSCEEIYQEKEFVKLAVSGRHKKVNCIFVKHNLFHQSKWSRTIDLNTTHIILFKSPRDTQQIDVFGRQLNNTELIRDCYKKATSEPYGHFMIDFDPRTSDSLRFCSNIVGPGPTIFYLPPSLAKETPLTNEREKTAFAAAMARRKESETLFKNFGGL